MRALLPSPVPLRRAAQPPQQQWIETVTRSWRAALLAQHGGLLCWVPVCLAIGIGGYFALPVEPSAAAFTLCGLAAGGMVALGWRWPETLRPVMIALMLIALGAGLAKARTESLAAPVLGFRYYGPIEGRVVQIDRSASDAVRLTLDQVVLARMDPARTPARVRVALHGPMLLAAIHPGDLLILTGHLSPPAGPAEPGGFDFQRHAYFLGLGAVGYTRNPVLRLAPPAQAGLAMRIFGLRMALSGAVQAALPGAPGAFAAAILTGDRSGMDAATTEALRRSNLAHLLAISGLHMGLLTGFVFAVIRYGLALLPAIALRVSTKKIAAVTALAAGAFYLALSGGNVATERAFIMVAVVLVAVLLDRQALTLRAVAVAAIIVLVWQPEALTGPGFQMSFAATVALIACFAALRRVDLARLPRWTRPVIGLCLSSFVAGMATAPYAAAHFNIVSHYGLVANLVSVPLMGVLVMPAAVLAACLVPFGAEIIGLSLMELGLRWILFVARTVAAEPGAVGQVVAPPALVLPLLSLGMIWVILWRGPALGAGRALGLGAALLAVWLWQGAVRPSLLVADDGALIGIMGPAGRALSKPSGSGFVAGIWLENDGDAAPQAAAAIRAGLDRQDGQVRARIGDWTVLQVSGKTALAGVQGCGGADLLITNQPDAGPRPCVVYDQRALRDSGALALDLTVGGDLRITTARGAVGARPWQPARTPAEITLPRQ